METPGEYLKRLAREAWERELREGPLPEDNLTLRQAEDILGRSHARRVKIAEARLARMEEVQILAKPYFTGTRDGGIDV